MRIAVKTAALGGLAAFLLALSGSQCARSEDRALNPSLRSLETQEEMANCVADCAGEAKAQRYEEQDRHVAAVQACGGAPECHAEEAALHVSIVQAIVADFKECKSFCHNQGGGTGGQ